MTTAAFTPPEQLHFTGDDEADRLLAADPLALLIGFALDQQVSVQKAFSGPAELRRRLGHLDPARIAAMETGQLEEVFRTRPALHRFPAAMARRVQALSAHVADQLDGDAARVWTDASDGRDLEVRLKALPSFGDMKVRSMLAILAKRYALRLPGLDDRVPKHPTLGDVDSAEALERYQAAKREHKARMRAEAAGG
ncbi:MAG TPA: HhH-GPD-type base excision DNA repair protein [Candidatus Limnocylindrales bacterium]|nr:HhH-GPD-type base excision DNA repair protein [Candidatus Limnocylindrales bacterium]